MQNGGQGSKSPFFLLSNSGNIIEKSFFYQDLWLFENGVQIFNFCAKNPNVSKTMRNWKLIDLLL